MGRKFHQPWWRRAQSAGIPDRVQSCPDPFKALLGQGAGFVTFCCTATHTTITEPVWRHVPVGQILPAPVAVTCLGITAKWVSICQPLSWLIVCTVATSRCVGTKSLAWETLLCQQWAHSRSGSEAVGESISVTTFSGRSWILCIGLSPAGSPLSVSSCPTWRTPLKWGMRCNEATYKINQVWHKNLCEMQPCCILLTSSEWSSLFTVAEFVKDLGKEQHQRLFFRLRTWRDRKILQRRVEPIFKRSQILGGWFFLFWSSYKKCLKMASENLIAMY